MADRQPLKFTPVGSLTWITNERSTVLQLGNQDFEDFAFSARTDLEWLNEHMADIFERTQVDVAELLKTPGRLRGKTPRTTRKRLGHVEPFAEVFGANKPGAVLPASDNRFYNALSQSPSNSSRASPTRAKSPAARSPDRLLRKQPDISRKLNDPMNDSGIGFSQPESLPSQVNDSGIWSASSEAASQQPTFLSQQKSPPLPQESAKASLPMASKGEPDDRRTTQQSFRTAQEEEFSDRPQSPVQSAPEPPTNAPGKQEPVGKLPPKSVPQPAASISVAKPRRSGRLRSARTSTDPESSQNEDEVAPPSSPPVARRDLWQPPAIEASVPVTKPESHPRQPAEPPLATIPSRNEEKQPREDPPTPVSERSVSGSPEEPTIRKSILNFAPLPAREPLTNKKKSLGVRATRESHIEQLRANGANRASWLNRKGNGKSLGATSRQVEHITNRIEGEQAEAPRKQRNSKRKGEQQDEGRSRKRSKSINPGDAADQENDSHGETERAVALHNKIFTQNLHVKIQQLGKHNATREARTTSVLPADPPYPDLSHHEPERSTPALTSSKSFQENELPGSARRWAEKSLAPSELPKSQLARCHTDPDLKFRESPLSMPASPKKRPSNTQYQPIPAPERRASVVSLDTTNSNAVLQSPPTQPAPPSPQKTFSGAQHQYAPSKAPSSPAGTPDRAISAVKSHTASVFKKAKEMLLKSSVASASAKVESLSPALAGWQGGLALKQATPKDAATGHVQPVAKTSEEQLYPDLGSLKTGEVSTDEVPARNPTPNRPRQSRNSLSKESAREEAEKAAPAPMEEAAVPAPLRKSPKKLKNAAREEELRQVREQRRKHQEEMLRKEKEELRRRQQEEIQREKEEQQRKVKEMTIDDSSEQEDEQDEGSTDHEAARGRVGSSAEPERPPSRLQKAPTSRFQKTTENKRPVRPAKEAAKPKPAPVSIRIGTASQREMQDQRNKLVAPSGSSLISALKSSFEPSQSQTSSFSQSSFQSSAPAQNPRGPSSNAGTLGRLKSLTAAANQLKKEQEEKERKLAAKREIERRRKENSRRQNQEDEQRKLKQKLFQAIPQSAKTLSRMQSVANLRQKSEEPENKKLEYQSKTLGIQKGGPSKRALQQDPSSDDQQYPRLAPPRPGGPAYQQEGAKKRRTGEFEEQLHRATKEMPPPIRPSVAKKELTSKATLSHAHAATPTGQLGPPSSSVPSISRPPTKPAGGAVPLVEGVKFSKDKIKFAVPDSSNPAAEPNPTPATTKTPGTTRSMKFAKMPAGVKESPIYQNGELIDLPEIPTDSEDDGDDDDDDDTAPKDNFHVPNWAESPELRQILLHQQETNPDAVFGPVARLDMEAIFHPRTDRQAARFRSRTSSANWSGADRLTPAEIEADQEARRRMIEQGGWVYSSSAQ